ncbi:MAG: hypothetical protein RL227_2769, partial [Pseudomonadota bacterium]
MSACLASVQNNQLLAALPPELDGLLQARIERVDLEVGEQLQE